MLTLFAPIQGDDIANRTGRKVFVKKIRISGIIQVAQQATQSICDNAVNIRMIVFQDMQTNGAQASPNLVLLSGAASDAQHMFQNTAGFGRFKMMKDKSIIMQNPSVLGPTTGALVAQNGLSRNFKMSFSPNCYVNFNATNGGTVADIIDNSWHLAANADSAGLAATITYKVRTVFTA